MDPKTQLEDFAVVGELPNHESDPCLMCKQVSETVRTDLFLPEPQDIPSSVRVPDAKQFAILYRLCPKCAAAKPPRWKIRLLLIDRLKSVAGQQR